jgi:putative membrane protein
MEIVSKILIGIVALEHLYIMWLEMFAWTTKGKKTFKTKEFPEELFEKTKALAANQGLYNGFLAAGLLWALIINDPLQAKNIATFFLSCVLVAGIYGGLTAKKSILFIQGLPALLALISVLAGL